MLLSLSKKNQIYNFPEWCDIFICECEIESSFRRLYFYEEIGTRKMSDFNIEFEKQMLYIIEIIK